MILIRAAHITTGEPVEVIEMRKVLVAAIATTMLGGTANAATYVFTAGTTTGTITTGAMSARYAGYYLLQSIAFDTFIDEATGARFTNLSSLYLQNGAAFNPTTNAFADGRNGTSNSNTGGFDFGDGPDFASNNQFYTTGLTPGFSIYALGSSFPTLGLTVVSSGSFSVIVPSSPVAGAVPEPATWAMMMLGFGMVGFGLRSRRKQSVRVTYA